MTTSPDEPGNSGAGIHLPGSHAELLVEALDTVRQRCRNTGAHIDDVVRRTGHAAAAIGEQLAAITGLAPVVSGLAGDLGRILQRDPPDAVTAAAERDLVALLERVCRHR